MLEPVRDDPRFHVVYELDPEKIVATPGPLSPHEQAKLRRRAEFVEQLQQERAREEAAKPVVSGEYEVSAAKV